MIKNTILNIVEIIRSFIRYLILLQLKKKAYFHRLTYKKDGFYLDGIKIIDQKATLQIAFLEILTRHAFYEFNKGIGYLSSSKICKELQSVSPEIETDPSQICYIVRNIRSSIKKKTKIQEEIIDSENWNGYRLNNCVLLGRN